MERRDLSMFNTLLQNWRSELLADAARTAGGMTSERAEFADTVDRGSLEGDRNLTLRIRDRERKLLTKIDEAIGRIDDGTFGICEECGGEIGVERLKARPVTTYCIQCKEEQEASESRKPK